MCPKIIAFYLPQYHRVIENDEWWGKGFTDWVSTRNAEPLFRGHNQPRVPLNKNYYNLLHKSVMTWQADLAKQSGVYGFCFYHYWFGNKQLLEKPAENLFKWKDIDIHYCFSWANVTWKRSWSKYEGGAWIAESENTDSKGKDSGLLIKQKYGNHDDWKLHFEYLLPFFQDERYIKRDNKPIFVIYRPKDIKHIKAMIRLWNKLACENGFDGIYFVGTNCSGNWREMNLEAVIRYEPSYTIEHDKVYQFMKKNKEIYQNEHMPMYISYRKIWRRIIERYFEKNIFPGGFVDSDTTPRMGRSGRVCIGVTPKRFYKYLSKLYKKCIRKNIEYIFLTAWNEWGEGAYLEPDKKYGLSNLKMIRKVINKYGTKNIS